MSELEIKGNQIIELFSKFCLDKLDCDWVKNVINSDFTEVSSISPEFEDIHSCTNFLGLFNAVINSLRHYIDSLPQENTSNSGKKLSLTFLSTTSISEEDYEKSDNFTKFWINITKCFSIKSLLAFLFYYIYEGQHYDANEHKRELGIHASSLYFLLLAIPGSNAFRVFHPILYLKSLDILKLSTKLNVGASSPKKGSRGSKCTQRKSSEDFLGEGNEDEEAEVAYLSPTEASKLIRSLNILLNDFLRLTNRFSLKHSPDSIEETVSVLVEVTRCEIHNAQGVFLQRHAANSLSALTYNAYVALQSICSSLHGKAEKTVTLIMKYITYNILMMPRGSSDLSTRALGVIREHSVIFVKYLMIQLQKDSHQGVYVLVQHLCLRVPDKADYREKTAKSITEILKTFPLKEYSQLLKWLFRLSHNEKAGHRLFTLEVISKLLTEEERQPESNERISDAENLTSEDDGSSQEDCSGSFQPLSPDHRISIPPNRNILSHRFLLCIIFSRCRDSAATVRSKALVLLSECLISNNPTIVEAMKQVFFNKDAVVFTTPHIHDNDINSESPSNDEIAEMNLPNVEMVMSLLQRRALDNKVTVRKAALQVMEVIMKLNSEMTSTKNLQVLIEHCRDPALLIRKQMVQSLTSLVETYPNNDVVIKTWVSGILPLILDPEIKVQEKVVELVDQLIFRHMSHHRDTVLMTAEQKLPWKILDTITLLSFHKFLSKILMLWSKSDRMSHELVAIAKSHILTEFSEQAWTLLALLSQYVDIKDPAFALKYFKENFQINNQESSYTQQQVLKVIGHSVKRIRQEEAKELQQGILEAISSLSVSVELISALVDVATLISNSLQADEEKAQKAIELWAAPILKSCDEYLKEILFPVNPSVLQKEEEERFFRYLFTLGEVAQLCPSKVNRRMFLMMQSIIFHQNHSVKQTTTPSKIPSSQTQSSQPPPVSFNPTRRLKTLAVVTLGKMCLQHEDQAKRIIPALGKMLDTTTLPAMKINIIIVLSDMCVRYATLVDPLMPQVTACLRDPDIKVRRTTLTLIINLLQEDYLKLKGSFFYRILQCLCDSDDEMRRTVIFFMTERLLKRFPKIFLQHFIECIFHYNCYEEHESYNKFNQSKQEKELFSLAGDKFREQRMSLYRFMLDHMMDDQRFSTTQKLCQDVLGGVVNGRIRLTPSSLPMLEDTLMVLSSDEIKLAWLKSRPEDSDQPTDRAEQAEMAGIVIKKTIISQVVKRNVIENIVPILIALKNKLAENRSPLMKQLLLYFKEIMKDYKNEVKEILAGDRQLAKEIEFDLRKLEEEEQREQERLQEEKEKEEKEKKKISSLGNSIKLSSNITCPEETPAAQSFEKEDTSTNRETDCSADLVENGQNDAENTEKSVNDAETSCQTSPKIEGVQAISSPLLKKRGSSVLLKQVLINCQKRADQKQQDSSALSTIGNNESTVEERVTPRKEGVDSDSLRCQKETTRLEKEESSHPVAKLSVPNSQEQMNKTTEAEQMAAPSSAPNLCTPPKNKPTEEIRHNLLRAISTPNSNQKVISNITFVDRSQEISSISFGDSTRISTHRETLPSEADKDESHTLLLHFKSPEAFAKDQQFSRLRRSYKKSLAKKFDEVVDKREKEEVKRKDSSKRPSGGFLESLTQSDESSDEDSSFVAELSTDKNSGNASKGRRALRSSQTMVSISESSKNITRNSNKTSKRTCKQASLSPITKTKSKRPRSKSRK